ncbi:hypothetical protein JCM5296_005466 [Sporobolomyces johnsonii]
MSFPLVATALLFKTLSYYHHRQRPAPSPSDADSPHATRRRRTSSRQSTHPYSPRLTRTYLAPPQIAQSLDEPSSSPTHTPPLLRTPPPRSPSLSPSSPESPRFPPLSSESTFPLRSPTASPSSSRLAHRTPSIASRRSSISSSIASIGFHPIASTTLQPVIQSSFDDTSLTTAAAQHQRRAGDVGTLERSASLGLGRPPLSSMLPPDPPGSATSPATLSITPSNSSSSSSTSTESESTTLKKRSFSLPFMKRKASSATKDKTDVPVVERLRNIGRK